MWSRTTDKGCMWHKASLISLKLVWKTNPIENWDKGMNCFEAEGRNEPACRLYSQHLCCEAQANHCLTEAALQKLTGLSLSIRQNLRLLFSSCWGSWWFKYRTSLPPGARWKVGSTLDNWRTSQDLLFSFLGFPSPPSSLIHYLMGMY